MAEDRAKILLCTYKSARSTSCQKSGFKIISRWYRTPKILHAINPTTSTTCWRCGLEGGILYHVVWSCTALQSFWTADKALLPKFTDRLIPSDPAFFLLYHNNFPISSYVKSLLPRLLNAARSCVTGFCRQTRPSTIAHWLPKVGKSGSNWQRN